MTSSTAPEAGLSRRALLAAAVAMTAAGCLQLPTSPQAAAAPVTVAADPRPHRTLLGLL